MKNRCVINSIGFVVALSTLVSACSEPAAAPTQNQMALNDMGIVIKLPEPRYDSQISVEQSLLKRRSVRSYSGEPLKLQEISQLLWSAQGITDPSGLRAAPSAVALYPLVVNITRTPLYYLDLKLASH